MRINPLKGGAEVQPSSPPVSPPRRDDEASPGKNGLDPTKREPTDSPRTVAVLKQKIKEYEQRVKELEDEVNILQRKVKIKDYEQRVKELEDEVNILQRKVKIKEYEQRVKELENEVNIQQRKVRELEAEDTSHLACKVEAQSLRKDKEAAEASVAAYKEQLMLAKELINSRTPSLGSGKKRKGGPEGEEDSNSKRQKP